jgi:signal transduction histidine kinase
MKLGLAKRWRLWLAGLWLLVTLSLAAWWMVHGLRQAALLSASSGATQEAARQQRMLVWEGTFLLSFVTLGGAALGYFVYQHQKRYEEVRRFFSTFTHELKTSLTSLRLQAEILEEDPKNRENQNLRRLLRDVVRLELQLENALILAQSDEGRLFLEEIPLRRTLQSLSVHWPHLAVTVETDARLRADQRALDCIFRNLLQNASVHGEATEVKVNARESADGLELLVRDNGKGFAGDPSRLGEMFLRHTTRSGSGLGLYLSRILAGRMGGSLSLQNGASGGMEARLRIGGKIG